MKSKLSKQQVKAALNYEPLTGAITYHGRKCPVYQYKNGSAYITVGGYSFYTNKLIFDLLELDITDLVVIHENDLKKDNRLINLLVMSRYNANQYHFDKRQLARKQLPNSATNTKH